MKLKNLCQIAQTGLHSAKTPENGGGSEAPFSSILEDRWFSVFEHTEYRGRSEAEDLLEIPAHVPAGHQMPEPTAGNQVFHPIDHQGALIEWFKRMRVVPPAIGPLHLPVREAVARFPHIDRGLPPHRNPPDAQFIVDKRPRLEGGRTLADYLKVQPGRRQLLEIFFVPKKSEDLVYGVGEPLLSSELFKGLTTFFLQISARA